MPLPDIVHVTKVVEEPDGHGLINIRVSIDVLGEHDDEGILDLLLAAVTQLALNKEISAEQVKRRLNQLFDGIVYHH